MKIHFIAVGGSIMHSLAIELKNNGYEITGSDDIIYDPAKSTLFQNGLLPKKIGWDIKNITRDLDLVILGMHAKKNNPELLEAQKLMIPIVSFPEFIFDYSKNKKRIVIAGSHGKTTITSMIIYVLKKKNIQVDYLVGAKISSVDKQVHLNNNKVIIIEGDEYFSSSIDLSPKFMHYKPDTLVVSGVAWDHVNVFPTLDLYQNAFKNLAKIVNKKGGQIYFSDNDNFLLDILNGNSVNNQSYHLPKYIVENGQFVLIYNSKKIPLNIFGQHNLYNIEAARCVCAEFGISSEEYYNIICDFKGANRRLMLIKNFDDHSSIYYDFAHSPSKVLATINALSELNPNRYLISCLELHTFSSLNKNFLPNYADVFKNSHEVWIYIPKEIILKKSSNKLAEDFIKKIIKHPKVFICEDLDILKEKVLSIKFYNTNLLLMSSGNFSGLNINTMYN
ncbi:MAG: peptidoglycan synthetase [Flavobacteriales bacterium]|nr:peptidoglycan synthetase [Flavobacteriales bacterium]|tara:strand:- start:14028 stop:15371 length:1344 start_codon:yes stop_codon:yes gene_type:complete